MTLRIALDDFELENPIYAGATVDVWTVDVNLVKTATRATLFRAPTGVATWTNPVTLDSRGKFPNPVYVDRPVMMTVTPTTGIAHDTAVVGLVSRWRGIWTTATLYYPNERVRHPTEASTYVVLSPHTSGVFATDVAAGRLQEEIGVTAIVAALNYTATAPGANTRTIASKLGDLIDVADYGAVGDNVTDDTAAIQEACGAAQLRGGGVVYLRPTGAPYRITGTIALGNGVMLWAPPVRNFAGMAATPAQWGAAGTWLRPEHPSNPAVRLQGHGSGVVGINFIHNQPIPGGSFTPTTYGYCISQTTSFGFIRDVMIVNAWNGIEMAYTSGSGGGTGVEWSNILVSAFGTCLRTSCVNDTASWSRINCRNVYYATTPSVVNYIRANSVAWDCGYTDNLMGERIEFYEFNTAILLRNETCLGITHSLYNAQLDKVQFNLCQRAVVLASTAVDSRAYFGTTLAQQGNAFGYTWSDRIFDLNSDAIIWDFAQLRVVEAGGEVMRLGNGAGGEVNIGLLTVEKYSTVAAGQVAFNLSAGSNLQIGTARVTRLGAAGLKFAGAGLEGLRTNAYGGYSIFGRFAEVDVTGVTGWTDWSTGNALRPGRGRFHLMRLTGEIEVFAGVAASTFGVRMSGITGLEVNGLSGATGGAGVFVSFDTGWVEVTEANWTSLTTLGRFQVNPSATGLRLRNGSVNVAWL